MFKWFNKCKSIEDVKDTYKTLCKQYHPDIAGADSTATMQEINTEFERAFQALKNTHRASGNDTGSASTYQSKHSTQETPEEFKNIISSLIHCIGVTIDLVGSWVWLTGNTYEYRNEIKELGFRWANNKKAWYWHKEEDSCRSRKKLSLDEIKEKYGCTTFETVKQARLTAR